MKETRSAYVAVALLVALSGVAQAMYVWPYPETFAPGTYSEGVDPSQFAITTNSSSALLGRAIERYQTSILFPFGAGTPVSSSGTVLVSLEILVGDDSEELQLGVDESYTLQILNPSTSATVTAQTVWGALRGLETFSQVVDWSDYTSQYSVNVLPLYVNDAPRFPWRGLLIDTARHFLLPSTIYRTIDAMSYNKFNTLHWHAVDAESFPVVSDSFPDLTDGAWFPTATYSHDFILDIVSYAKDRGIRVVPEFDIPGHAYSWGAGYPNITTDCPDYDSNINNVPLDPTIDFTWDVLSGFIPEMAELFDDKCFHVGGDEVIYSCWNDDPSVVSWMQEHSTDAKGLLQYFEDNLAPIITGANKTAVVWEDLFDNGIQLDSSYIVEVWSEADTLQELINAGFRSISAYGYYLNDQEPLGQDVSEWVDTWQVFYGHDVMDGLTGSSATLDLVLGGEAAMWGEQVDSVNYDSRVWPRACGVIERLWSPSYVTDVDSATTRLIEHRCRLARRGIGAGPVSPDYCSIPYTPYSCNGPTSADATVIGHK